MNFGWRAQSGGTPEKIPMGGGFWYGNGTSPPPILGGLDEDIQTPVGGVHKRRELRPRLQGRKEGQGEAAERRRLPRGVGTQAVRGNGSKSRKLKYRSCLPRCNFGAVL